VSKKIAAHGAQSRDFVPNLAELIASLRRDPKQYPKKTGALQKARAANLRFRGRESWRAVFIVHEAERRVHIIALAPHDRAYDQALRRI
jgi:hypothetical protein